MIQRTLSSPHSCCVTPMLQTSHSDGQRFVIYTSPCERYHARTPRANGSWRPRRGRHSCVRAPSAGRRAAVKRRRLVGASMAPEPVLLDLQAHELLLGEWLAEDLLEPDCVHPTFHPCHILRRHSCEIGIRRPGLNAAIVAGASDGPVARLVLGRPAQARGSGQSRSHFPQIAKFWGRGTFRCPQRRYAKSENRRGASEGGARGSGEQPTPLGYAR
jgi:hypothetical protein